MEGLRTGLFFISQMVRLRDAGIPVYLIAGNHDAANKMTKTLEMPDNVHMFSAKRPQTLTLGEIGVAIHGQSFATEAVTEDLAARYPANASGMFNIGLLHTCATGSGEHERYAPCTLDGLRGKEYQYWALGHIHKREILHRDPLIVFPGNLQGRHIRETRAQGMLFRHSQRPRPSDRGVSFAERPTVGALPSTPATWQTPTMSCSASVEQLENLSVKARISRWQFELNFAAQQRRTNNLWPRRIAGNTKLRRKVCCKARVAFRFERGRFRDNAARRSR